MTSTEVPLGAKVSVSAGVGFVRWTGSNAKFAAGKWVGVELLEPNGKNDGSVQGQRYFDCAPKYGVFVRPSQVQILELPTVAQSTPAKQPPPTPSGSRVSSATPARTSSPLKPSNSSTSAGLDSSSSPPPRKVSSSSTSIPPPSSPRPTPSRVTSATSTGGIPRTTSFRRPPSVAESTTSRAETPSSQHPNDEDARAMPPPPVPLSRAASPIREKQASRTSFSGGPSVPIPPADSRRAPTPDKEATTAALFAQKREMEEMKIKMRILESRRAEDQERIKSLESKVGEADALRAARVKSQAKFQELQSSLVAAQRSAKDLQSENAHLQNKALEAMENLEMATLDREVAEEKAEASEIELEKSNEKIAESEMEMAVLKEENAEYEKPAGSDGERSSLAFVQLEKHNERLKEASIRLRDVSSDAEKEYKAKISDSEKESSSQEDSQSRYESAEAKLANAEAQIEDLKVQSDDALGAEDMSEQSTERNLQMGERIEEMRMTIEDLEALKELNDESEEGHVEAEKQLNEEIDKISSQSREERARSNDLDAVISDMETTSNQFRNLVSDLQSEIDDLRMRQATQDTESATNSKDAQAILNSNLKLQSSAAKAQGKTIDFDLKRLQVAQSAEQLNIVTAYLPDKYHETEADPTTSFLFFKRISSKVDTLINTVSSLHGLPSSLQSASAEPLVGICELRGKLRHFSTLNKRFGGIMSRCSPDDWVSYGKTSVEVGGVENKVDGWINGIRNEAFNEGDCVRELGSLIAQFDHLCATVFDRPELDVGEQQLGFAYAFEYDSDNFAAAVGYARQAIVGSIKDEDIEVDVGESSLEEGVYEPVQRILDSVRTVKIPAGKLVAEVESVVNSNSASSPDTTIALSDSTTSVSNAVDLAVQLAQRISAHVASLRVSKAPSRLSDIEAFLDEVTAESAHAYEAPPWESIGMFVQRLGAEIGAILPKVKGAAKAGQIVPMAVPPPWLGRVAEIKAAASYNADTERKVVALSEELKDMLREIKIRDQSLQESGVKVETSERRSEATRKQADQIIESENDVAKAKKQEKVYEEAIEQLQRDSDALEAENAKLGKGDRQAVSTGVEVPISTAVVDSGLVSEQVENSRTALRFLRRENASLKGKELYKDLHLLPKLAFTPSTELEAVPESDPSGLDSASSISSDDDDSVGPVTPSRHTVEMESRLLWREVSEWTAVPKIVDVSKIATSGWVRKRNGPEEQLHVWQAQEKESERRVERLKARTRLLGR